jgi:hypothetical protein
MNKQTTSNHKGTRTQKGTINKGTNKQQATQGTRKKEQAHITNTQQATT